MQPYPLLNAPLLYNIDFLNHFCKTYVGKGVESSTQTTLRNVLSYSTLLQGMFSLRGLKFIASDFRSIMSNYADGPNQVSKLSAMSESKLIAYAKENKSQLSYTTARGMDKLSFGRLEQIHQGPNIQHTKSAVSGMSETHIAELGLRYGLIAKLFSYMCAVTGDDVHPSYQTMNKEVIDAYLSNNPDTRLNNYNPNQQRHVTNLDIVESNGFM